MIHPTAVANGVWCGAYMLKVREDDSCNIITYPVANPYKKDKIIPKMEKITSF